MSPTRTSASGIERLAPRPLATHIACVTAVALFLVAWPDHRGAVPFAPELLAFGLIPAFGVYLDWVRLERPSADDGFFAGAALGGALVVGLAPGPITAFWHPVLLVVALTVALRRRVVAGHIAHVDPTSLSLDLGHGRLTVDRSAHEELGDHSSLELSEGASLALVTGLHHRTRGAGPFRSAQVLTHGAILDVDASEATLRGRRLRHAALAVSLVLISAAIGWGAALANVTIALPCHG